MVKNDDNNIVTPLIRRGETEVHLVQLFTLKNHGNRHKMATLGIELFT